MAVFENVKNEITYRFDISQVGKIHTHGDLVNVIDELRYNVCLYLPKTYKDGATQNLEHKIIKVINFDIRNLDNKDFISFEKITKDLCLQWIQKYFDTNEDMDRLKKIAFETWFPNKSYFNFD
jgi:hypothetical protein